MLVAVQGWKRKAWLINSFRCQNQTIRVEPRLKKIFEEKIQDLFLSNRYHMLKLENKAILRNESLRILREDLLQSVTYYKVDSTKRMQQGNYNNDIYTLTKDYLLSSHCL